jgi:MFS family permease
MRGAPDPEVLALRDAVTIPAAPGRRILGVLDWPASVTPAQRRSLLAGGLGWLLDAMDVMLYSLVLAHLMRDLGMDKPTAGLLNSLTLAASAIGGALFGFLADRVGRTRALMVSILIYSFASGACGLSTTIVQLAAFRFVLGLGMGGEWTAGAALIAETWPAEHRGKALGLMQSAWAIGEVVAAGVVALVLPAFGWRAVFFAGVLPALVVFWIRKGVPESPLWLSGRPHRGAAHSVARRPSDPPETTQAGSPVPLATLWRKDLRRNGAIATALNACSMFGYWGLFTWIPAYLSLPVSEGGRGLDLMKTTTWLVVMGAGKWLGYVLFGFGADRFGRRRAYVTYLLVAALLVPLYGLAARPEWLLVLGPLVAFFGTGYFSGFAALTSELFPTEVRATAMGLSYNIGRGLSAFAPFVVGALAARYGLGSAFLLQAAAFLAAALFALALPETKGRALV